METHDPGEGSVSPMSADISLILQVLFPKGEVPTSKLGPEEISYLSRLGTQGLDSLMGEVARVNEELAIIEHQTRDMASQNYQIFVQSAQTTNLIKKSLSEAKNSVETLSSKTLPEVKKKTDEFVVPSEQFLKGLRNIEDLAEKEQDFAQVLDMPWVVRRCLANGDEKMLPEAIKILHIVMDYKKTIGENTDLPVALKETMSSVLDLQTQIQNALLQKLHSPSITLSECLQTIQLLRNFFPSDKALRFRFLQSRMNSGLQFENSRSWIFDTLTQHRAAFGQDSSHYLSTFIALQIQRVLNELGKQVEEKDSKHQHQYQQNVEQLFMNGVYFGESLARVGADLRGLNVPLFSDFILRKAGHEMLQAEMNFSRNLHHFNLATCLIQQRVEEQLGTEIISEEDIKSDPEDLRPPSQLLIFLPLAVYLNEILQLLNFIGKCSLVQCLEIARKLNQSVGKVGHELEGWGQGEWVTWDQKEQNLFHRMRSLYEQSLVPHLDKCFKKIYPPKKVAKVTGMGVSKCAEIIEVKYCRPVRV